MTTRRDAAILMAMVVAVAGCSILKPQPDPSRFYVLTAAGSADEIGSTPGGLRIGLGPLTLPDYLDRSPLVTRVGPNRVQFSDFERWAEPLDRNVSRVMIENLTRLLHTEKIVSLPSFLPVSFQYQVPVEVQRFEGDNEGVVELIARWAIIDPDSGAVLRTGESRISDESGWRTEDVVAALSRALAQMCEEIAAAIRGLASS